MRPVVAATCLAALWVAACAAEPPQVNCPIAKPKLIPAGLKTVFSQDPKVELAAQLRELNDLDEGEAVSDALRWLIHQPAYGEDLRVACLKLLCFWRPAWLADDLCAIVNDPAQPLGYRLKCVTVLAGRDFKFSDHATALAFRLAQHETRAIRDRAVQELARLAWDLDWQKHEPKRHAEVDALLDKLLSDAETASVVAGWEVVTETEWASKRERAERMAAVETQAVEAWVAALAALAAIPGPQTLTVVDGLRRAPQAPVAEAARRARPFALVHQMAHAEKAPREQAYRELAAAGEEARPALEKALHGDETDAQAWAKGLLGKMVIQKLGLPLVDTKGTKRLFEDPKKGEEGLKELVLDIQRKLILADASFILEQGPLEYAVVSKGPKAKLHETIIALDVSPSHLSTALLACGIVFAGELRDGGKVNLPRGAGVMLSIEWEFAAATPFGVEKKPVRLPIEAFVWNLDAKRFMKRAPWAFTGSRWVKGEDGKMFLLAEDERSVAAIRVDSAALLNTPLDSAEFADFGVGRDPVYEIYRGLMPKRGVFCRLVLEPWTGEKLTAGEVHDLGEIPRRKPPIPPAPPPKEGPLP